VPFIVFVIIKRIPRRLIWRCLILLAMGGLQGLIGWWMVSSAACRFGSMSRPSG
jgi:cytochrome c oxidase assembly protein subunit 15